MRLILTGVLAWGLAAGLAAEEPSSVGPDLDKLPANTWNEISAGSKPLPRFCSVWYLPATGEFMLWGAQDAHRHEGKVYEVQTLDLKEAGPRWKESFPHGKEAAWSAGKFPNWGCGCHQLNHKPDRPWLTNVRDQWIGGFGSINVVSFTETEGVKRPTRTYTHHQAAYDTKRDRLVYYVGGRTFAYDPKKREWSDLGAAPPECCDALAWASMAYDPEGDRLVLFGGAYALNPWGGAKTWLFDCAGNRWSQAKCAGGVEPPLRCCAQLVYDSRNKVVVLFGGNALDRALADTWTLDLKTMAWKDMKPATSPPPVDRCAACYLPEAGKVFLATPSTRWSRGQVPGAAWVYDAAANSWTPLPGDLPATHMEWISCGYSPEKKAVVLNSPGVGTWLYRPDLAATGQVKRETAAPGAMRWNNGQIASWEKAPEPDLKAREAELKALPANQAIDSKYPGQLTARTWSTATIDTARGVVVYIGGGHCGYSGTDIALYDVGANRWSLDSPPCNFPWLWGESECLYGWDYRLRPNPQHTYRWYAYDPVSRLVVYCTRPSGMPRNGFSVQRYEDEPAFVYDQKKHGSWTFLFDPATKTSYPLSFGRSFGNGWSLALCTTPEGVFAKLGPSLFLAKVTRDEARKKADVSWELLEGGAPSGDGEFQPLVCDTKRQRLLFVAAPKGKEVQVWEHPLGKGAWQEIKLERSSPQASREVVYDAASDCLLALHDQKLLVLDLGADRKEWRELDVALPKGVYGTEHAMVYDPVHKLCVMLIPREFSGYLQTVLFRYDPKTAKFKAQPQ